MHKTLEAIRSQLDAIIAQLKQFPNDQPFSNAHGNWTFPGLTGTELVEEAQSIISDMVAANPQAVGSQEARLVDYVKRLEFLRTNTVPQIWGSANQAVPAYIFTLQGLRNSLKPVLNTEGHAEAVARLRKLQTQLRGMESRYQALEPRTVALSSAVDRIEKASDAADQLPTDLVSLSEARQQIDEISRAAVADQGKLNAALDDALVIEGMMKERAAEATSVLAQCHSAYSAATSVGLAAAFSERSAALGKSMWIWVAGLVVALAAGSSFGSYQLHNLSGLVTQTGVPPYLIALNLILALLSVGAPIWFSWLATKQVGQRFRLAEDYAFKASVARAYEGFRREAARYDEAMAARLLSSALDRLDELPLRLVETETHGSPWHELASSPNIREAMKIVPGFTEQVGGLARVALGAFKNRASKAAADAIDKAED